MVLKGGDFSRHVQTSDSNLPPSRQLIRMSPCADTSMTYHKIVLAALLIFLISFICLASIACRPLAEVTGAIPIVHSSIPCF